MNLRKNATVFVDRLGLSRKSYQFALHFATLVVRSTTQRGSSTVSYLVMAATGTDALTSHDDMQLFDVELIVQSTLSTVWTPGREFATLQNTGRSKEKAGFFKHIAFRIVSGSVQFGADNQRTMSNNNVFLSQRKVAVKKA